MSPLCVTFLVSTGRSRSLQQMNGVEVLDDMEMAPQELETEP